MPVIRNAWNKKISVPDRWILTEDSGAERLKCPDCGGGIILAWYEAAVGTAGYHYCPYCGADMGEPAPEQITLFEEE